MQRTQASYSVLQCLPGCFVIRLHQPGGASSPDVQSQPQSLHLTWAQGCENFYCISCEGVKDLFPRTKAIRLVWLLSSCCPGEDNQFKLKANSVRHRTCSSFELLRALWSESLSFALLLHTVLPAGILSLLGIACDAVVHGASHNDQGAVV